MTIGNHKEVVGTSGDNIIKAKDKQIGYGLAGEDILRSTTDPLLGTLKSSILVGGFDDDTYIASKRGVTIVMDYGNTDGEDIGIASGISLFRRTTFTLEIDRRHLLAGDSRSGQIVVLIDWKQPRNRIENIRLADGEISYSDIADSYKTFENYLGNFSWKRLERLGINLKRVGLSPSKINKAIRTVINRVEDLQGIDPQMVRGSSLPSTIQTPLVSSDNPFAASDLIMEPSF
jgi:hypothetical protein